MEPITRSDPRTARSTGAAAVAAAAPRQVSPAPPAEAGQDTSIRPFRVNVPGDAIADLERRLTETRWPDQETVADASQGTQLASLQELVGYWRTTYDWRSAEARLNAYPQFKTRIDGLDLHFIHVRSRHPNAMPLIITHGWPGSVFEQIKLIDRVDLVDAGHEVFPGQSTTVTFTVPQRTASGGHGH